MHPHSARNTKSVPEWPLVKVHDFSLTHVSIHFPFISWSSNYGLLPNFGPLSAPSAIITSVVSVFLEFEAFSHLFLQVVPSQPKHRYFLSSSRF